MDGLEEHAMQEFEGLMVGFLVCCSRILSKNGEEENGLVFGCSCLLPWTNFLVAKMGIGCRFMYVLVVVECRNGVYNFACCLVGPFGRFPH